MLLDDGCKCAVPDLYRALTRRYPKIRIPFYLCSMCRLEPRNRIVHGVLLASVRLQWKHEIRCETNTGRPVETVSKD